MQLKESRSPGRPALALREMNGMWELDSKTPPRACNPALHFSHVPARSSKRPTTSKVGTAIVITGRRRPAPNIPNDAKVAGPKHRLEDLGSHVGECFREFLGPGRCKADKSRSSSDRGLVFMEWVVPAACDGQLAERVATSAIDFKLTRLAENLGIEAVLLAMVRLAASGALSLMYCCASRSHPTNG